jgi:hypothetical protein
MAELDYIYCTTTKQLLKEPQMLYLSSSHLNSYITTSTNSTLTTLTYNNTLNPSTSYPTLLQAQQEVAGILATGRGTYKII